MPRVLSDMPNELRVRDNISGSEIVLYHRMPETEERKSFFDELTVREGDQIINCTVATRVKWGAEIMTGFREGDFVIPNPDYRENYAACEAADPAPKTIAISSDPKSAHYAEDWKAQVVAHAADLVELLGMRVFETPAVALRGGAEKNLPKT